MILEGSCHCGAVHFRCRSATPVPYMRCHCSICRKTAGGGGFAINLMARADSLEVTGEEALTVYQVRLPDGSTSPARRHFCGTCGSALWLFDPRWPEQVHPFASAIDTPLPPAPERAHIMLGSKANWVPVPPEGPTEVHFDAYPDQSIADWHAARGLTVD
ncbi:MAG: GFA family protein [Rhodobacterales bacterium]|nr:GFA family protein [Rhodobacterales bacterium]